MRCSAVKKTTSRLRSDRVYLAHESIVDQRALGLLGRVSARLLLAAPADDVPEGLAGQRDRATKSAVPLMTVGAEIPVAAAGYAVAEGSDHQRCGIKRAVVLDW